MVMAFVLMVALVPSKAPESVSAAGGAGGPTVTVPAGKAVTGDVKPCADRKTQDPKNSYAPPCFEWSGDNGGATSKGVTGDEILVSYRKTSDPDYVTTVAQLAHADLPASSPDDIQRTVDGLVDYFNKNFQFYGRKIKLVPYDAKGTVLGEIFGGGQDAATSDAVKASTDLGVFADVTGITQPYSDALAKRKVIAFGAPYMSDEFFNERRPYAWSSLPSCTLVSKAGTESANKELLGRPANWAGPQFKGQKRKVAVVVPDNPEYQRCLKSGLDVIHSAGNELETISYTLDLSTMQTQAASIVAKLKDENITSVACACDPLLPLFLTKKAHEQDYTPEWTVMGTALTDTDIAGQLYDQDEWSHAFGISALGDQLPINDNLAYHAYKSVRSDEPVWTANVLFFQILPLALGIQMAGPNLTPETFEQGLFACPELSGENGTWKFSPGMYTPLVDAKTVWWNPEKMSPMDDKKGAYETDNKRYRLGGIPAGDPHVFGT